MDVVYVVKKTQNDNLELRYSLRSLQNIQYDRVFIVGFLPDRCHKVIHIPIPDDQGHKYANVLNKFNVICDTEEISDDFVLMHDDIFVLKPVKNIEYHKLCSLKEHATVITNKFGENPYYQSINGVMEVYPDGDSFDAHCPIILNKSKFASILQKYGYMRASKRSLYCNEYGVKGVYMDGMTGPLRDCKISDESKFAVNDKQIYLSISDEIADTDVFRKRSQKYFAKKSIYEKSFTGLPHNYMLFKSAPNYNVSLPVKFVQFNSLGEFETDDDAVIEALNKLPNVEAVGEVEEDEKGNKKKVNDAEKENDPATNTPPATETEEEKAAREAAEAEALKQKEADDAEKAAADALKEKRAEYKALTGSPAYHKLTIEEIDAKIEEWKKKNTPAA